MHWSEPKRVNHKWITTKYSDENKVLGKEIFNDKEKCLKFLRTINVYIDGELMYSGEQYVNGYRF